MPELPAALPPIDHLLPESIVGAVKSVAPLTLGLSGASVYAVSAARGEFVLRIQSDRAEPQWWAQQLLVLRRASEHGIAPAIVLVDEGARAVVSTRVAGVALPAVLGDPAQRLPAIQSVIAQLRNLHGLDTAGVEERDPMIHAREAWDAQRKRDGYPVWAAGIGATLDSIGRVIARDPRRVVSHNDVNPGNVLWDGTRAWLVDWEVAGLGHPYFDLAGFVTFLDLAPDVAFGLLTLQEQTPLDDDARAVFLAFRQLVTLLAGNTFLGLAPDLTALEPSSWEGTPSLAMCYAEIRQGLLDLQSPRGQIAFGLALLRAGTASP